MAIKTYKGLFKALNKNIDIAVENTCNRLLGSLQEIIETEFYDAFEPDYYSRTLRFWRSAISKMVSKCCGQVLMDESKMNYNDFWTGEKQIYAASIGSHGNIITNETKQHRFWEVFEEFCEENTMDILKEELKKKGVNVKN